MGGEHVRDRLFRWVEANQAQYNEGYYEQGEGSEYYGYRWRPELIAPFVAGIVQRCEVQSGARVLDFGCAKGFYVRVLVGMGYDAVGIDISEYALAQSPKDIGARVHKLREEPLESFDADYFDLTIAKDVLEHVPEFALEYLLHQLKRISRVLFVVVPLCNQDLEYINPGDRRDRTHRIRRTREQWMALLKGSAEADLCSLIKRDKSKGTLCCRVECTRAV